MVLLNNSVCTLNTGFHDGFDKFISQCASVSDIQETNNLINPDHINALIEKEKAIQTDLTTSLNGIKSLRTLGGVNNDDLRFKSTNLEKEIESIKNKINENENKTETQNQIFLQTVSSAPKKTSKLANLNDLSLAIFFCSIFIFSVIISVVQATKINGSMTNGIYTFIVMVVIIIVVYAIIKEVA